MAAWKVWVLPYIFRGFFKLNLEDALEREEIALEELILI